MMSAELAIINGSVVTGQETASVSLVISEGRVSQWLEPGAQINAKTVIDARGKIIIPGAIDIHVHMREPGLVHKEGFASGSKAAAAGGVTTMMVMPTDDPWTLTPQQFEEKKALAETQCHVDFALQAAVVSPDQIAALAALGAISFEVFLGDSVAAYTVTDMGILADVIETASRIGRVVGITPADDGVIQMALSHEWPAGANDRISFFRSRPPLSENLGVAKACAVAVATGAAVHLRQISNACSVEIIRAAQKTNPRISGEVTPHNLTLTEDEIVHQGPYAKVLPPLRSQTDVDAMWQAVREGVLRAVASDHAPHTIEEKQAGEDDIWKAPGGFPGLQTLLPILIDAVAAGKLTWMQLVQVSSQEPARLFGLYPAKGSLLPGADADLVIIDPDQAWTISDEQQYSRARKTPFAGRRIQGKPVQVFLRGREIMRDFKVDGHASGRFVRP